MEGDEAAWLGSLLEGCDRALARLLDEEQSPLELIGDVETLRTHVLDRMQSLERRTARGAGRDLLA
jgi:hypothetical protein